jgi:transglutaminase-like putative cysteine protease
VTRGGKWLALATSMIVVAAFGMASELWLLSGVIGCALLVAGLLPKWEVTPLGQVALILVGVTGAWFLTVYVGPPSYEFRAFEQLNVLGWFTGMAGLLVVISRQFIKSPRLGKQGDALANFFIMIGSGDSISDPYYPVFVLIYIPLQLLTLSKADLSRPGWSGLTPLHRRISVASIFVAALATASLVVLLPLGYDRSIDYFTSLYLKNRAGFSRSFSLGSIREMHQSDDLVMRISGSRPGYLRGIVYARYDNGDWLQSDSINKKKIALAKPPASATTRTTLQLVSGERDLFFLPLNARGIQANDAELFADITGILSTDRGDADRVSFAIGPRDFPGIAPPTDEDIYVPPAVERVIGPIARRWADGLTIPRTQLSAIRDRLRADFTYSLSFERTPGVDPVIDFLTERREGHCEYFAAAMALAARSIGIPARVVGGYVVEEYNEWGDFYVVRERDAHAWVEAWEGEAGWRTYDATPPDENTGQFGVNTSGIAALTGLLGYWMGEAQFRVTTLTMEQIGVAIGVLLLLWLAIRQVRVWREQRGSGAAPDPGFADPLPALLKLLDFLAHRGARAAPGEPLERFADRVAQFDELGPKGPEAAGLLQRYAAWRYGDHGEENSLSSSIGSWISKQS